MNEQRTLKVEDVPGGGRIVFTIISFTKDEEGHVAPPEEKAAEDKAVEATKGVSECFIDGCAITS